MIAEKAYAKINLTLSVGEKREDGYHEIDSVMHSISLCDEVKLTEAGGISLSIKEGLAPGGKANLMWEAAELFFRETGFSGGAHMELVKQIHHCPPGLGIQCASRLICHGRRILRCGGCPPRIKQNDRAAAFSCGIGGYGGEAGG